MASAAPAPKPWGTSDDIEVFRRDIARLFERLAAASEANPPPGSNAANGYFVKAVRDDNEIKAVIPPRRQGDDPEGQRIYVALVNFENRLVDAFHTKDAYGSLGNIQVAWDTFTKLQDSIKNTITAIGALVTTHNPTALAALAASIKDLIEKVDHSKLVYKGEHANGNIEGFVRDAATELKRVLDDIKGRTTDPASDPFARLFADKLSSILDELIKLKFANDPWLRPEWQLSFQAITKAGSIALYGLKQLPTAPRP